MTSITSISLPHHDLNPEMILVDASNYGSGYVILQKFEIKITVYTSQFKLSQPIVREVS